MHAGVGPRPGGDRVAIETILIVEDEVLVRLMIAEELRDVGFQVIEAAHADEALTILAHRTDVAIVISDIRMPGSMDGLSLARKVRLEYPTIYIVLTSGHLRAVASEDYDAFFSKPYESKKVVEHIKAALDKKTEAIDGRRCGT